MKRQQANRHSPETVAETKLKSKLYSRTSAAKEKFLAISDKAVNPITLLVAALTAIYIRGPQFFESPRIWAEEGSIYLRHALENQPLSSFLTPHLGYYSLFNKISILFAAEVFPLKHAALVATVFSAALQVWTCLIIYSCSGRLARNKIHRCFLAFLPLLLSYPEVWLNTINGQFWLATGAYFILNSEKITKSQILYLFLAFATGVSSLFFLPYFALRAATEKTKQFLAIAAIGGMATAVQLFSLFATSFGGENRFRSENLSRISDGIVNTLAPYSGQKLKWLFLIFMAFAIYIFVKNLIKRKDRLGPVYGVVSLLTYTILSVISSLGMEGGGRYSTPVQIGLFAIAISNLFLGKDIGRQKLYVACVSFLVASRAATFFDMNLYSKDWPGWFQQMQERKCDQETQISIFPPGWKTVLPKDSGIECKLDNFSE